ncbi:MAG TPA: hypothetical protein VIM11_21780 [Tepidisphaeraceae bacterium]
MKSKAGRGVLGSLTDIRSRQQVIDKIYTDEQRNVLRTLFDAHAMDLLGPPMVVE